MKHTRFRQFVARLTRWHNPYSDIRFQPFVMIEREMTIEEARSLFSTPEGTLYGRHFYEPLENHIAPTYGGVERGEFFVDDEVGKPPYAWWRTNNFCVNWCFRIQRLLRAVFGEK